jgi:signal transduction histidine kinase
VRTLGLERAVLLLEEPRRRWLVRVAGHGVERLPAMRAGEPPAGEPWSLSLPIRGEERALGVLLLDAGDGKPLSPEDRALAEQIAEATASVLERPRLAKDLSHTREMLARADRLSALGMLAASVAHEIRNPLVSVRTFIQLLPERLADEEFRTTFRDLALSEIERICGLINDLLAFSRPTPSQREPTDMNELVAQIVRLLDVEARKCNVTVACRSDPDLPAVTVDHAQVKQVLMNVVLNAIQACDAQGEVEVATRVEERDDETWCVLSVADSGRGIAPEHHARVFEPFFTTKDAGSGLGLFIARQIVTGHGGHIGIAARPGGGTEFSIHLPFRAHLEEVDAGAL